MTTIPLIMFADDDDDDRMLFESALKKIKPETGFLGAAGGLEALEILDARKDDLPHLLFLDINMPGFSGWQCLEKIRSNPAFDDLTIIMYSTSNNPLDIEKALLMGAFCFCTKPDTFTELVKFLTVVVDRVTNGNLQDLKTERFCSY